MKKLARLCLGLIVIGSIRVVLYGLNFSPDFGSLTPSSSLSPILNVQVTDEHLHSPNHDNLQDQPYHFVIRDDFTLPMPRATHTINDLVKQQWMEDLQNYLHKIPPDSNNPLISIVSCDAKFKDFLLNWLISATINSHPPLSHILILSLDRPLHNFMVKHGFDSVYVAPTKLLIITRNSLGYKAVLIVRLTIMRLLNHWGYDTANYDTDAILLNNPEPLYYGDLKNSDLIGSRGVFPLKVSRVLGVTLCAGVFMIKSSPETEKFWEVVSRAAKGCTDDQWKLNIALTMMNLSVTMDKGTNWEGKYGNGFTVTVLHQMYICRFTCKLTKLPLYVWHNHKPKVDKKDNAKFWFLREDWIQRAKHSRAKGVEWLEELESIV